METKELIPALRLDAEWAHANEWETPITLGDHLDAAADALAAYEDLGLTPEEIAYAKDLLAAEKDGRCVVLPCNVGDTVYKISYDCTKRIRYNPFDENGCSTAELCLKCDTYPCDIHKTVIPVTVESKDWMWENKAAFGKTVFLTRAEAEEVLGKEAQS